LPARDQLPRPADFARREPLMNAKLSVPNHWTTPYLVAAFTLAGASLVWAHWTTLCELAARWSSDPQYSHGYLVPLFALFLLWLRRDRLRQTMPSPNWCGLVFLAAGIGLRLTGTYYHYIWVEQISLLPCLAGIFVLLGGWPAWRWSWPAIAFLFYM